MGIFTMPSLGADMEAGKLVEWTVKPGDTVKRGDIVAVVETQKGAIEIETFDEGTVTELTAELGRELPVGAPLAVILKPGEDMRRDPIEEEAIPPSRPVSTLQAVPDRALPVAAGEIGMTELRPASACPPCQRSRAPTTPMWRPSSPSGSPSPSRP